MAKLEKVTCPRCGGSGNFSFNHIHGTLCYGCNGAGHIMADPVKLAKNKAARERRAAQKAKDITARVEHGNRAADEREQTYKNDSRIGPQTRARCEQFPAVAYQTYKVLHDFDRGQMDNGLKVHPSCIELLAA